jgi:hypothetical protein
VKNISIQGVCKPLEAVFGIAKVERPEDQDFSFSRFESPSSNGPSLADNCSLERAGRRDLQTVKGERRG